MYTPIIFKTPYISPEDEEKFWSRVDKTNTCWNWLASTRGGYGKFYLNGSFFTAHRVSFTLINGQIPENLVIDHLCRNKLCVNPEHLQAVSYIKNIQKDSPNKFKEYCDNGHKFTQENTYLEGNSRKCIKCSKNRYTKFKEKLSNIRKKDKPSKEILEQLVNDYSWREIGLKYGVTDTCVKKWAKKLGIEFEIRKYSKK